MCDKHPGGLIFLIFLIFPDFFQVAQFWTEPRFTTTLSNASYLVYSLFFLATATPPFESQRGVPVSTNQKN